MLVLLIRYEHDLSVDDTLQMLPVGTLAVTLRGLHELVARNPAVLVGDLLHDRDGQALRALHGAHELPRLEQGSPSCLCPATRSRSVFIQVGVSGLITKHRLEYSLNTQHCIEDVCHLLDDRQSIPTSNMC